MSKPNRVASGRQTTFRVGLFRHGKRWQRLVVPRYSTSEAWQINEMYKNPSVRVQPIWN